MSNAEVIGPDGAIRRQGDSLAPQGAACSVYRGSNVNVATGVTVPLDQELFDPYGWWSTATNRFQPTIPGYYRISWSARDSTPPGWSMTALAKNGTETHDGTFQLAADNPGSSHGEAIIYLNGTTDYASLIHFRSDASSGTIFGGTAQHTYFHADLVASSAGVVPEPWHIVGATGEPAFQNGWANYDVSTFSPTAFFKDPSGIVHLRGLVKAGTVGDNVAIFTLPAGYRPIKEMHFATASNGAFAYSHVIPSGVVDAAVGNNTWFSLDNIHFRAEQ